MRKSDLIKALPEAGQKVPLASLRAFLPFARPYRLQILAAIGALLMVSGAMLSMGRGLAYLVDEGLGGEDPLLLAKAVIIALALAAVLATGSYFRASLINRVGEQMMADIRRTLFAQVMGLSASWFEAARTGDVLARLATDTAVVQAVLASALSMAVRNIILLTGGLALVILSSPKMSLVVAVIVPLVVVPLIVMGRRLRRASRLAQERLGDVSVQAEEALSGIRTVHAFGQNEQVIGRYNEALAAALEAALTRVRLRGILAAIVIFLVVSGVAAILWIGGRDLQQGLISPGDLSAFVFYAFLVASATGALSELGGDLQRAAGAADRIAQLLAVTDRVEEPPLAEQQILPTGAALDIDFEGLSFTYPARPQQPALSDISLQVAAGERVALVGPSGAGKSTLFHLLLRFYEQQAGQIRLGGLDIRRMGLDHLRSHIAIVPQDPALFSASVRENIAFGVPDAGEAAITEAARLAEALDFIHALPDQFDTPVGEKGVRLSGGQRQRLAIARAILRNPSVLLLDEATSALDSVSEAAVQSALASLMQGRTSLVIAHRLATVLDADRIILLDQGRIIASGTHEELLADEPLYRDLALRQFHQPVA
jgi:ATP-binding cassette subfamily B protein